MRLRRAALQIPARSFLPPGLPFYKIHPLSTHSKSTLLQLLIPLHFNSPRINTYKKPGRGCLLRASKFCNSSLSMRHGIRHAAPPASSIPSIVYFTLLCMLHGSGDSHCLVHFPSVEGYPLSPSCAVAARAESLPGASGGSPSVPRIQRRPAPRPPEPARRKVGVYSQPAGGQNESPPSVFHKKLPRRIGATQPSPLTFAGWSTQHAGLQTSGTAAFDYHPAG